MNKEDFLKVFTPENRYSESQEYLELSSIILDLIRNDQWHSKIHYIDHVYFNQTTNNFEVDILITEEKDLLKGILNLDKPIVKLYTLDEVIFLLNNNK